MTPRNPASFVRRAAQLLMPVLLVGAAQAQPPQEAMPVHDRTLTAPNPQQDSHFGYTMTGGKVDPPFNDTMDDLAVCAPHENEGAQEDVSAIYLYLNSSLDLAPGAKARLLPKEPYNLGPNGIQMGVLETLIGNPRGPGQSNLVIAGASTRRVTYPGHVNVDNAGSVEIFDINPVGGGFEGHAQLSLIAPGDQGPPPTAPIKVGAFGHGLALGDVTGDGTDDLTVGAPATETPWGNFFGNNFGRVYVFRGQSSFMANPYEKWVGINAPQQQFDGAVDLGHHMGSGFGTAVVAVDFDADGKVEVVAGRPNRIDRNPRDLSVYTGGSAWILRGSYVASFLSPTSSGSVIDPPRWPYQVGAPPEYQVLLDPFNEQEWVSD